MLILIQHGPGVAVIAGASISAQHGTSFGGFSSSCSVRGVEEANSGVSKLSMTSME